MGKYAGENSIQHTNNFWQPADSRHWRWSRPSAHHRVERKGRSWRHLARHLLPSEWVNGWMRATLWSAFGYNCNIDVHLSVTTHHRPEPNMPDINKTVISSVLIISDPRYRREADTRLARRAGRADSLGLYWHLSSVRVSEARTRLGEVNMTKQISSKHREETCIRLLAAPTSHVLNKD